MLIVIKISAELLKSKCGNLRREVRPKTLSPLCYFDKDAEVPGETNAPKQESAAHKKASLHMWVKKAWKKNRGKERAGGWGRVGMGWDERARGEDAVPMVHQKLMQTASV